MAEGASDVKIAYDNCVTAETEMDDILQAIKDGLTGGDEDVGGGVMVPIDGIEVDITKGSGALVLDNRMQELSLIEQSSAQIVGANNTNATQVRNTLK